ncbi:MAG TPA: hypothetical protein P5069_16130 [Candidatus Hydrogenedentes bacterium]|nr:hypothetical protein [Candidatus Hydrogenedentota bacterium]HOH49599.1 hypothetical protein [Candidatus Hydrogenedentota bacterium]HRZ83975.1 hypothetical protein [Candidatus Hydrogenedentota bacterium]
MNMENGLTQEDLERIGAILDGEGADPAADAAWLAANPARAAYLEQMRALRGALAGLSAPEVSPGFAERVCGRIPPRRGEHAARFRRATVTVAALAASLAVVTGGAWVALSLEDTAPAPAGLQAALPAEGEAESPAAETAWPFEEGMAEVLEASETLTDAELAAALALEEDDAAGDAWLNTGEGEAVWALYEEAELLADENAEALAPLLRRGAPLV